MDLLIFSESSAFLLDHTFLYAIIYSNIYFECMPACKPYFFMQYFQSLEHSKL